MHFDLYPSRACERSTVSEHDSISAGFILFLLHYFLSLGSAVPKTCARITKETTEDKSITNT